MERSSIPHVLSAADMQALEDQLSTQATRVTEAVNEAKDRWGRLREVFEVFGAEGAYAMLDIPANDAQEFSAALFAARVALSDTSSSSLPALERKREDIVARVAPVNQALDDAEADLSLAETTYWRLYYRKDATDDEVAEARERRIDALHAHDQAERSADDLRADIDRFRKDVEEVEQYLADSLGRITGGTDVHGAWNETLSVSQMYWGVAERSGPYGQGATIGLEENLRDMLSRAIEERIEWLGTSDRAGAQDWLEEHPDFSATVGFVDPEAARRLWEGFVGDSTTTVSVDGEREWAAGPLAQLFAIAPFAIGNLNGLRAGDRSPFNRETLRQLLNDESITGEPREQLNSLLKVLDAEGYTGDQERVLLSLFLSSDGTPRASVGFGDVDTADQITTLSHGIESDLGSMEEWADSASRMQADLRSELDDVGSDATTATVLFFEWDSGSKFNVWNVERPDGGAERLAQLQRGFALSNPDAQRDLGLHSLGTTMGTQMITDNPGLVQNVWLYGSAGVTEETAAALRQQIADGDLVLHATHADDDYIAPIGRWPASEHSLDPRDIEGVEVFGSDGGFVEGYGSSDGEQGERTEGHNSQASTDWFYLFEGLGVDDHGNVITEWDDESVGYLDPRSQSFKQTIMDLVRAAGSETGDGR